MIMIVTISHITHENYKDDPGLDGTYTDFIKGFKDVKPGSLSKKKEDENEDRIKKILKAPGTNDSKKNNSSSVEDTIIDRIR